MNPPLPGDWPRVRAARVPTESMSALAPLRDRDEIQVHLREATCWVVWTESHPRVVELLLSVQGVEFAFEERGRWFRVGSRLPLASGPPKQAGKRLSQVLQPERFTAVDAETKRVTERLPISLVRGGPPQSPTALRCRLSELIEWSETATSLQLRSLRAAYCGDEVLLLGESLPTIADATRYWGEAILIPVGFRVEPELPMATIRSIFGTLDDELLILDESSGEKIRRELFEPLTRAGLRAICSARENRSGPPGNRCG